MRYRIFITGLAFLCINLHALKPEIKQTDAYYEKENYCLVYNEDFEQATWVYYEYTTGELYGKTPVKTRYRTDKSIITGSALSSDYTHSGYDRGHLVPLADLRKTEQHVYEASMMSNISPQVPSFNRGIWKHLETKVRHWVKEKGTLKIVTGGIVLNNPTYIGKKNKVAVPDYFFKAILSKESVIAFILPNEGSKNNIHDYVVTVDYIEEITGLNLFYGLPEEIESVIDLTGWF